MRVYLLVLSNYFSQCTINSALLNYIMVTFLPSIHRFVLFSDAHYDGFKKRPTALSIGTVFRLKLLHNLFILLSLCFQQCEKVFYFWYLWFFICVHSKAVWLFLRIVEAHSLRWTSELFLLFSGNKFNCCI
jgi:hypothetical protein